MLEDRKSKILNSNHTSYDTPQFHLLTDSQIKDIHNATLEILREVGLRFKHDQALEVLREAGAYVTDENLVRFPPGMVEEAISSAPGRVVLTERGGDPAMYLEGTKTYFGTGSDTLNYLDPFTGETRKWQTKDINDAYRVVDALDNIDFLMSVGMPEDKPEGLSNYQWQYAHMLQYSTKPSVIVCDDREDLESIIDMATVLRESREDLSRRPNLLLYSEPTSPLQQSETALSKLLLMSETELPVVHSPAPMMGSTGPIRMAGEMALCNAEILSSLVLHQLYNPGAPFVYGAGPHHFNMKDVQICYGSPEFQLTKTAVAEIGRYYGIPTWGYAGCSDAKVMDEQAASEATMSVIMAKLSGANLIHDVGYMESGLTTSLEMVALTDELIDMSDHMMGGIPVTDETLMLEQIKDEGPGGDFLGTPETVEQFRDYWEPDYFDRSLRDNWENEGSPTTGDRLNEKVKEIIEDYEPERLADDTVEEIMDMVG
ncbi:MAG: trimethylamine methyltransferase family protein [Candidatus Bipolaricaulota bacterium]